MSRKVKTRASDPALLRELPWLAEQRVGKLQLACCAIVSAHQTSCAGFQSAQVAHVRSACCGCASTTDDKATLTRSAMGTCCSAPVVSASSLSSR